MISTYSNIRNICRRNERRAVVGNDNESCDKSIKTGND